MSVALMPGLAFAEPAPASKLNWIVDGRVEASVRVGNTLYIGGTFTSVAPGANALGTMHALSPVTGQLATPPSFPLIDGLVRGILPDDTGGYYLWGEFATVGGVPTRYLTHVLANGTRDAAFAPQLDGQVARAVRSGATLILSGFFSTVGGQPRNRLAQVDATTGQVTAWTPTFAALITPTALEVAAGRVYIGANVPVGQPNLFAFDVASGAPLWQTVLGTNGGFPSDLAIVGSRLIVAGDFVISPSLRNLVSVDPGTGVVDPAWAPNADNAFVTRVLSSGSTVYVSGFFSTFGGQPRQGLAAVDASSGALLPWRPDVNIPPGVMTVLPNGNVIVGGTRSPAPPYRSVVQITPAGTVLPWTSAVPTEQVSALATDPGGAVIVGSTMAGANAVPRLNLAAFDLVSGGLLPWAPAAPRYVSSLATNGQAIFVGGGFDQVSGLPRAGLAAVDAVTGAVTPWAPLNSGSVSKLLWHGGKLYVNGTVTINGALSNFVRLDDTTGLPDAAFHPFQFGVHAMTIAHGALYAASPTATSTSEIAAYDLATGAQSAWRVPVGGTVSTLTTEGDSVYVAGQFATLAGLPRANLAAFDRRTGVVLGFAPQGLSIVDGMAVADGLVVHVGISGGFGSPATSGIGALRQDGQADAWNPGYGRTLVGGGASTATVAGDVLVLTGMFGTLTPAPLQGVAVFDLQGSRGPTRLRSSARGPETVIEWDAAVRPPAGGYVLEAGGSPGQVAGALPLGSATSFVATLPPADYYVRVRSQGAGGGEMVSNEVLVSGRCTAAPAPPAALTASLSGLMLTLQWAQPEALVTHYVLTAGASSGASDLATVTVGGGQTQLSGAVPPGTYFVRVQAVNACGTSGPSAEVFFTAGAVDVLPAAPSNLVSSASGGTVALAWTAPAGTVTGYVVEAGRAPGLSDLGVAVVSATPSFVASGVPPGVYFVRVRAVNGAGSGAPSADVIVAVP